MPCHQILKLYAWEPSFQAQVEDIRVKELKVLRKFAYLTSVSTFLFTCAPALVSIQWQEKHGQFRPVLCFHGVVCSRSLWSRLQCM